MNKFLMFHLLTPLHLQSTEPSGFRSAVVPVMYTIQIKAMEGFELFQ